EPLGHHTAHLSQLPIWIDDDPTITVSDIRDKLSRREEKPSIIFIDYLQLIGGPEDSAVARVSNISRELKILSRELEVPVVALSQLSRAVESRTNKRPVMSDLRESGAIEQDADLITMLYREEYYNPDTPDRGLAELIIVKHRNGPTGTVKLLFEQQYTRFRNLAPSIG
ncbi:MAG: DnaB-like helicase C-terminal domain-containing protein, partial [Cyanobacteria bacterium J06656_5]